MILELSDIEERGIDAGRRSLGWGTISISAWPRIWCRFLKEKWTILVIPVLACSHSTLNGRLTLSVISPNGSTYFSFGIWLPFVERPISIIETDITATE